MLHKLVVLTALSALAVSPNEQPCTAHLVAGRGAFFVTAESAVEKPWVRVSIPVPYRGQTPLAVDVATDPADSVKTLRIVRDGENRFLEVEFVPLAAEATIRFEVTSLVLERATKPSDGRGAKLSDPESLPADVRVHLGPAPGVDSQAPEVLEIARTLSRDDLASSIGDVLEFLERKIGPGSGPQGALEVLARGSSACTGAANLSTAMLVAAGVPARILPCVMIGMEQQEHYIVEAWSESTGWVKFEPTLKRFPLDDTLHLVLRFVDRDTPRSGGSVPLHRPVASPGLKANFDDRHPRRCWQSATKLLSHELDLEDVEALEALSRKRFEEFEQKSGSGSQLRFAPKKAPIGFDSRGRKLLEKLDEALSAKRR